MSYLFRSSTSLYKPFESFTRTCKFMVLGIIAASALSAASARERVLLDAGWRFRLGDPSDVTTNVTVYLEIPNLLKLDVSEITGANSETNLIRLRPDPVATHAGENVSFVKTNCDDSAWRALDLPHDWAVELPFNSSFTSGNNYYPSHGYKTVGDAIYTTNNIGWYRHTFTLPAGDAGKAMRLEFDGIYRNALIWLNGRCIGRDVSGYAPISFDVTTNVIAGGTNVLVVRVDANKYEGWFYEGAGIYRHVWLTKTDPVHVGYWGTYVTTTNAGANATITVQTTVTNQSSSTTVSGSLTSTILDANSNAVTAITSNLNLTAGQGVIVTQTLAVANANLWSLQTPYLYNLVSTVSNATAVVDVYQTPFGVRTVRFDATNGVFINGQHVWIQGMCVHQDHAGVGVALPDRVQYFRIERLKQMGVNAYRTSHNQPAPEILDACDRLGMLVLDETRRMGNDPESLGQLERMVRRDRNHPSVFCWSLGNEEWGLQWDSNYGPLIMNAMQNLTHSLDSTRLCTVAANNGYTVGDSTVADVVGFNYSLSGTTADENIDAYHSGHLTTKTIGTETASTVTTRGIYTTDNSAGYLAAYDIQDSRVSWGAPAEVWWPFYYSRPWSSGGFCWTGFDYRGEETPFGWPCINSHFGVMDTCGFAKDNFYYYQANWTLKPVLHILPHWNWSTPGQPINIWVYGNCDLVELFTNGVSLGRQVLNVQGHVEWDNVPYTAGTLQAVGYLNGDAIITNTVATAGTPAAIALWPDRSTILADGRDVSVVTVAVLDSLGRVVPIASNLVNFAVSGGAIIGVGNGDPSSHEPDKTNQWQRQVFNGFAQVIVQSTNQSGSITLTATSTGLTTTNITLTAVASPPAPVAPSGVAASAGNRQAIISWDIVPGATTYNLWRATTSGPPYTLVAGNIGGVNLGYADNDVTNLTAYYYVVSAVNAAGESAYSIQISATPHTPPVPATPAGLTAIPGDGQVSLSWTGSSGATNYNIKRSTTGGGPYTTVTNVATTSVVNTGLTDGTTYYFVLSALNTSGESADSGEVSAKPRAVVSGLTATVVNSRVQLQWNAHAGATGYNVKRALGSGGPYTVIASNLVTTSFTDFTANTCQSYYYVATVIIGGVESVPSSEVSVSVPYLPWPFQSADIGTVGIAGSATSCSGPYTVTGSGDDIWNSADAFQFVYVSLPVSTNCDVRAKVLSISNGDGWAKAGVMIRESLATGSRNAYMVISYANNASFQYRTATDGSTANSTGTGTAPYWVRVTRTNNTFRAYRSSDGTSWSAVGSATTISMAGTGAYVGLAVTAHNNAALNTSVFTNFTVLSPSLPVNTAPVLAAITNRTVNVGQTVAFTARATDTDSPSQTLTFSLLNWPSNATLIQTNNTNAAFSWQPWVTNANTTNPITLKVADNATPGLSATQSFTVTVNRLTLPVVPSVTFSDGQFTLQVTNSIVGPDYAVLASSNLVDWTTLFITNSPATNYFQWTDTNAAALPMQFYRIKVGPPLP